MQQTLDLGVIGNGSFGALVDRQARVVWGCLPAFDGDPAFCALLSPREHDGGDLAVELEDFERSEQEYVSNTAVLRTVLHDQHGGAVEVLDFAPRWKQNGRIYRPVSIVRRVRPLAGTPQCVAEGHDVAGQRPALPRLVTHAQLVLAAGLVEPRHRLVPAVEHVGRARQ